MRVAASATTRDEASASAVGERAEVRVGCMATIVDQRHRSTLGQIKQNGQIYGNSKCRNAVQQRSLRPINWSSELDDFMSFDTSVFLKNCSAVQTTPSRSLSGRRKPCGPRQRLASLVLFMTEQEKLNISIYIWVAGLVVALVGGAWLGGSQLHQLADAIQGSTSPSIVWTRLAMSLLSVGGPIWFAWLATKQIGQRFKLAEDYAYKASVSKAYEGYRREALHLDEDFRSDCFPLR